MHIQIPIHQDHQRLLQFQWEEKTYQFMYLPFGVTSTTRVFTKVFKPPLAMLRHMGIQLVVYLDDILILHQSREELECLASLICSLFEALGLVINIKNSILIAPTSHRIPEVSDKFCNSTDTDATGEAEENSA